MIWRSTASSNSEIRVLFLARLQAPTTPNNAVARLPQAISH